MADIFKIKSMDAKLDVNGVEYKICDPNYMAKNALFKKGLDLEERKKGLTQIEQMEETRKINLEMVSTYIPDIPTELLQSMGSGALTTLMNHLLDLSEKNFGAVVEKVEKKSEAQV